MKMRSAPCRLPLGPLGGVMDGGDGQNGHPAHYLDGFSSPVVHSVGCPPLQECLVGSKMFAEGGGGAGYSA